MPDLYFRKSNLSEILFNDTITQKSLNSFLININLEILDLTAVQDAKTLKRFF